MTNQNLSQEKGKGYWAIRWIKPEIGFEEFERILSVEEKRALTNYKQFNSLKLNNMLRGYYHFDDSEEDQMRLKFYNEEIDLIDKSFSKVPSLKNDLILYSGISKISFTDKIGKIFSDPAYVSSTTEKSTADRFGAVIKIKVPKGIKVIPMDPLGPLVWRKEHEILLPRNQRFLVTKDNDEIMLELLNE